MSAPSPAPTWRAWWGREEATMDPRPCSTAAHAVVDALLSGEVEAAFRAGLTARRQADHALSLLQDALPLIDAHASTGFSVRLLGQRIRNLTALATAAPVEPEAPNKAA